MNISVAEDFSRFPAGRFLDDGPFPGAKFREQLVEALRKSKDVTVQLDGTMGYGSSFLEEAFGGLVRLCGLSAAELHLRLHLESSDPSLLEEVWAYVDEAQPE